MLAVLAVGVYIICLIFILRENAASEKYISGLQKQISALQELSDLRASQIQYLKDEADDLRTELYKAKSKEAQETPGT